MKILLLSEYVEQHPWSPSAWAVEIARGLHARGHDVLAAIDGADDASAFAPVPLLVRRPMRGAKRACPLRFARWTRTLARRERDRVSLSLTHLAPGSVWIPIGPTTLAFVRANLLVRLGSPGSMAAYLAERPWIPHALIAERAARAAACTAIRGALNAPAGDLPDGRIGLGHASRLPPPAPDRTASLRRTTRAILRIDDAERIVLLSGMHLDRPGLAPFLAGAAGATARPVVVAPAYRTYRLHRLAARAGMNGRVRLVGATAAMEALLAAADLAAAPFSAPPGMTTGRFVCDAVRAGRPVLAREDAPGADLIALAPRERPGEIVAEPNSRAWAEAIDGALDARALERMTNAAHALAPSLGPEGVLAGLESLLGRAAAGEGVNPG